MFELDALTAGSQAPIPVLVPADGLFTFLVVVEDRFIHRRENKSCFHQSTCIRRLSIKDKLVVQELADRFDCEGISARLKLSIDHYYASSSGLELLAKASEANLLVVAKIAIGKLGADQAFLDKSIYRNWWTLIKGLRPGWQVELTRLVWKNQYELVNRPNRLLHPCGRRVARKREVIMVQTASSWAAIAAAFNPPKVGFAVQNLSELMIRPSELSSRYTVERYATMRVFQAGVPILICP
jgi:hypothetical protein